MNYICTRQENVCTIQGHVTHPPALSEYSESDTRRVETPVAGKWHGIPQRLQLCTRSLIHSPCAPRPLMHEHNVPCSSSTITALLHPSNPLAKIATHTHTPFCTLLLHIGLFSNGPVAMCSLCMCCSVLYCSVLFSVVQYTVHCSLSATQKSL